MIEGHGVARAKEAKPVLADLETAYLAWAEHFASQTLCPKTVEVRYRLLQNVVRGVATTLTLFPYTHVDLRRCNILLTNINPMEGDWSNVGRDLYSAILKYRMAEQFSDRHSRETEPSDPVCSR